MTEKVQTLLVDPCRLHLEALATLLDPSRYHVIALTCSIDEAIDTVNLGPKPDLCVVSYANGDRDEVSRLARLREAAPQTRYVVLSSRESVSLLAKSLEAGVDAFLLKDISPEALERALAVVMIGQKVVPTRLGSLLIRGMTEPEIIVGTGQNSRPLSEREIEILSCLISGCSNKVIAMQMDTTEAAIKDRVKAILRKIRTTNRTQAAVWALKNGIEPALIGAGAL